MSEETQPVHPETRIGHVHLRVANLDRAISFYNRVLGFEVVLRFGNSAAFLSAGGYHHHIGLNTWESLNGKPPRPARQAFITWRSSIQRAHPWPTPSAGSSPLASRSMAHPTTASVKPSISATLTVTASSSTGIARANPGPRTKPAP